jgi:predicted transcriptional regulator
MATVILGDLEKQVLHYLWSMSPGIDAKQVHRVLSKSRGGSLNTIQSTLDRLYKKGLLSRAKQGHAYLYSARLERREVIARLIDDVTRDFVSANENGLLAAFASVSDELDDKELDRLERLIEQARQRRAGEDV